MPHLRYPPLLKNRHFSMDVCPFDQLASYLNESSERNPSIQVTAPTTNLPDFSIVISAPCKLIFDPSISYFCPSFVVSNSILTIENLHLTGFFSCQNGAKCSLRDSEFHHTPEPSANEVHPSITITANSDVIATNCRVDGAFDVAFVVDSNSRLNLTSCLIRGITHLSISVSNLSLFTAKDTTFENCLATCLSFEKATSGSLTNCLFQSCRGHAVAALETHCLIVERCTVRNCEGGAVSFRACPLVHIAHCEFQKIGQTVVFAENSTLEMSDSVISESEGNGINMAHHSKVTISRLIISKTKFPAIAICDNSAATIRNCWMTKMIMNGVVVRVSSTARFSNCWIEGAGQHAVCVSDSKPVTFSRCVIGRGKYSCLCVYNASQVTIADCLLIGESTVGVDVFTGGRCDGVRSMIVGMKNRYIHVHHGGSVRFAKLLLREGFTNERIDVIVRGVDFEGNGEVPVEKAVATESRREVIVIGSSISGSGRFDFTRNIGESPRPPEDLRKPLCEGCGEDAGKCLFSPCGHAKYCRKCWDGLEEKPTMWLCMGEISKVFAPVDCSWEGSEASCPICAENEVTGFIVPCGHTICEVCATTWFEKQSLCPYCRFSNAKFRPFVWHS
jgi:hypothetical protein